MRFLGDRLKEKFNRHLRRRSKSRPESGSECSSTTLQDRAELQLSVPVPSLTQATDRSNRPPSRGAGSEYASTKQPETSQQQNSISTTSATQEAADRCSTLLSEALKQLSPEDREELLKNQKDLSELDLLGNILHATEERQQEYSLQRWKFTVKGREIVLADKATKIIEQLNKFKCIVDVAASSDPIHAALPWAAVRFLISVRQNFLIFVETG